MWKKNRRVSSRKAKVNFIRIKNKLRLGYIKFYCVEKVSTELLQSGGYDYQKFVDTAVKSLKKEYKLELKNIRLDSGLVDDDFIKDRVTMRTTISK